MRCLISACLALAAMLVPATAQDIVLRTLDVHTSYPAPPWTETARIAADTETLREKRLSQRGTDTFLRAYVPKGQDFDNWQERYEVMAETPVQGDAERHRNAFASHYQAACVNAALAPVQQKPERQVFMIFCPSFRDRPEEGALIVTVAERRGETLVQVNYHQRVPAFDLNDRASFPKTREELRSLVRYLNSAHLIQS